HGLANSLMLPTVIEFNRIAAEERLATAAIALGADPRASVQERAQACAMLVDELRVACGLPRKLSQAGGRRAVSPRRGGEARGGRAAPSTRGHRRSGGSAGSTWCSSTSWAFPAISRTTTTRATAS